MLGDALAVVIALDSVDVDLFNWVPEAVYVWLSEATLEVDRGSGVPVEGAVDVEVGIAIVMPAVSQRL